MSASRIGIDQDPRPVSILYTGGTFGMRPSADGLVPHPSLRDEVAGVLSGEAGGASDPAVPWTYAETDPAIDSAETDPSTLGALADRIRNLARTGEPRGIVVIHGTDTMAYSAAFAAFALADLEVPVVFTGSQYPVGATRSDAPGNLARAFNAVGSRGVTPGVWIGFGDRIIPAVRARKRSSESPDAFSAKVGVAKEGAANWNPAEGDPAEGDAARPHNLPSSVASALRDAAGREVPRVGLVKVSPGLTAEQFEVVLRECPAGIVLECYGSGTAPVRAGALAAPILAAVSRGSVVVAVTQCEDGGVELGRYAVGSELADAGVVSGGDMTSEAALGKLAALARAGFSGEGLRELFERNLLGERRA